MLPALLAVGVQEDAVDGLLALLQRLPSRYSPPVVVSCRRSVGGAAALVDQLWLKSRAPVLEVDDKQVLEPGSVHVCPADYELLVDRGAVCLMPARDDGHHLDRFFQSAVDAYGSEAAAVLVRGRCADGERGLEVVAAAGGCVLRETVVLEALEWAASEGKAGEVEAS